MDTLTKTPFVKRTRKNWLFDIFFPIFTADSAITAANVLAEHTFTRINFPKQSKLKRGEFTIKEVEITAINYYPFHLKRTFHKHVYECHVEFTDTKNIKRPLQWLSTENTLEKAVEECCVVGQKLLSIERFNKLVNYLSAS